jgi:hypothetical protein
MGADYEKFGPVGDLKREPTADSDLEMNVVDLVAKPEAAHATRFTIMGWEVSAQRAPNPIHQIPRKPVGAAGKPEDLDGKKGFLGPLAAAFDRTFPSHKRYCFGRLSRRALMIVVAVAAVVLLALIIGLSVGLSKRSGPKNIPLPNNAQQHSGDLTYYEPGLGACGITSSSSDSIVAVSHYLFDAVQTGSNPNANPLCGKKIRATRYDEQVGAQRSVDLTVVDRCVGCQPTDLDVTTTVFDQLAPRDWGRVGVTWAWLDYAG